MLLCQQKDAEIRAEATAHVRQKEVEPVQCATSLEQIGVLAAIYPATWGIVQLGTGAWSDRIGRKWLIASGMWVQAAGITLVIIARAMAGFATGAVLLGIGTAMVYPTLLAAITDATHPAWRASSVGVYRLWRDLG
jgi:MFS family permease